MKMRFLCSMLLLTSGAVQAMGSTQFGTYSQAYLDRQQLKKWKELCKGGGRYQAMSEAYNARKPDPCHPEAKEWVR